jgi:hypothetical protein
VSHFCACRLNGARGSTYLMCVSNFPLLTLALCAGVKAPGGVLEGVAVTPAKAQAQAKPAPVPRRLAKEPRLRRAEAPRALGSRSLRLARA